MTRSTLFILIVLGSAASAVAAIAPQHRTGPETGDTNVTVIEKNQAFPLVGPLIVERCKAEDCSDSAD